MVYRITAKELLPGDVLVSPNSQVSAVAVSPGETFVAVRFADGREALYFGNEPIDVVSGS